jgi:pimeloyl-ACP methyl ester carboxylesterase
MNGGKAEAVAEYCAAHDIPFIAFDCFAHGQSDGEFIDFTIGRAIESALEMLDHIAPEEMLVIGSSMGGWVALQAAIQRPRQVKALIGIAAAPDFTERLMYQRFAPEQRAELEREGKLMIESEWSGDFPLTLHFIQEARQHLLLEHPIPLSIPVHLLQGQLDEEVPWQTALDIAEKMTGDEVAVTLLKDGDHRLSRQQDLALLLQTVERLRSV